MFGSLVIVYPAPHSGGGLVLRHGGSEWTVDSSRMLADQQKPTLAYIAFFGDVEHEVLEVTSGYRITVTYNLYSTQASVSRQPARSSTFARELATAMQSLLDDPTFLPEGGTLGFCLAHQYAVERERIHGRRELSDVPLLLKGSDATVVDVCKALGLRVKYRVVLETPVDLRIEGDPRWDPMHVYMLLDWIPDISGEIAIGGIYDLLIEEGAKVVTPSKHKERFTPRIEVKWVVPPQEGVRFKTSYTVYGNEATAEFRYTNLCVLISIGRFENERKSIEDGNDSD